MKRGYTKAWRKELESSIWMMPPIYHRVWYWIRQKVQHEVYLFPSQHSFDIWVLPGQRLTSIQQIAEGVKWYENRKEIIPNKRTISRCIEWLVQRRCVAVTSDHLGTLITVINWDTYNHIEPLQVTGCEQPPTPGGTHKKRMIKNVKEEKEKPLSEYSDEFLTFWKAYPKKTAKGSAWIEWKKASPPLPEVLKALEWQKVSKKWLEGYILDPERYIKRRCWEDEPETIAVPIIAALRGVK